MNQQESPKNWFAQIYYLHYLYIIFILLAALVGVISYYHCGVKDKSLHEFISFAATLSSIILSVLAIFITVMSGESTNKLRDGIIDLLKIPEDLSKRVNQSVKNLNDATENLNNAANANEKVFQNNSKELQNALEGIKNQMGENFKNLDNKIDDVVGKQKSLKEAAGESPEVTQEEITEQQLDIFLSKTSSLSIVFIYLIDHYLQKNIEQPVSLQEVALKYGFAKELGINSYLIACIVFLSSFGLIQYKQRDKNNIDQVSFSSISEKLRKQYVNYYAKCEGETHQKEIDEYLDSLMIEKTEDDSDSKQ